MSISGEHVGELFTINGKDAWRMVMYCESPTATFENIETKERCGGAAHSPNVQQFKKLTSEAA